MTTLSEPGGRRRHATMNDVARTAGVSLKTVSRVVNGEPGVHPGTSERVLAVIEQLGFRRNPSARNLRRGVETGTLGLVVEDLANPFSSVLARAAEEVARTHDRHVLIGSSGGAAERERDLALDFCARRVDGLLIVPTSHQHHYLASPIEAGMPAVFVDRPAEDLSVDTALLDNAGAAHQAVRHLAAHGHERIAFLGDSPEIHTAAERLRGFREACAAAGLRSDLARMGPHTPESVAAVLNGPATALVTGNNRITVLALRALVGRSPRPALVGFDDFELADLLDPPTTVVCHDSWELGRAAAEMLFARLDGETAPPRRLELPARLLPRGSGEVKP
jgi:LacI family transcriptional regulator